MSRCSRCPRAVVAGPNEGEPIRLLRTFSHCFSHCFSHDSTSCHATCWKWKNSSLPLAIRKKSHRFTTQSRLRMWLRWVRLALGGPSSLLTFSTLISRNNVPKSKDPLMGSIWTNLDRYGSIWIHWHRIFKHLQTWNQMISMKSIEIPRRSW